MRLYSGLHTGCYLTHLSRVETGGRVLCPIVESGIRIHVTTILLQHFAKPRDMIFIR